MLYGRSMPRTLILLACTLLGCDALTVHPFAGSVLALTIRQDATTGPSAAGHHLELWARDASNDILRVQLFYDSADYKTTFGVAVRQAISLDDPCMIDDQGNLLVTPAAYPSTVDVGGVVQTPEQQAQQIRNRIAQLTAPPSGIEPTNLLALVPYDPTPLPVVAADAAPADRLAACQAYWAASDAHVHAEPAAGHLADARHGLRLPLLRDGHAAHRLRRASLRHADESLGRRRTLRHRRARRRRRDIAARSTWPRRRRRAATESCTST